MSTQKSFKCHKTSIPLGLEERDDSCSVNAESMFPMLSNLEPEVTTSQLRVRHLEIEEEKVLHCQGGESLKFPTSHASVGSVIIHSKERVID